MALPVQSVLLYQDEQADIKPINDCVSVSVERAEVDVCMACLH